MSDASTTKKDDEEYDVLASVDAQLQEQTAYEGNVLRQATLALAPQLSTADGSLGFPATMTTDLMGGGGDATTNLPALLSVLATVRRQIKGADSNTNNDLLYMKEQILLQVLADLDPSSQSTSSADLALQLDKEQRSRRFQQSKQESNEQQQGDEDSKPPAQKRRRRIPMMQRKQPPLANNDIQDAATTKKASKIDTAKLYELRQQRAQQKLQRRQQQHQQQFSSSDDDDEAELELEDTDDEEVKEEEAKVAAANDTIDSTTTINAAAETARVKEEETATIAAATATTVCPICQCEIAVLDSNNSVDAALAQHMSTCQQQGNRRSSRRRDGGTTATTSVTEVVMTDDSPDVTTKSTKKRKSGASMQQQQQQQQLRVRRRHPEEEEALDDWEEWDYEDRVDEWIAHGIADMKQMKERDETEEAPGAVDYGGQQQEFLHVPAWVNDHLFAYQREGLQWMWELHQNLTGGIVGDEMGLGKTVQVASYLGVAAASRKLKSVLIVAPATMLQHWLKELTVWAPGLRRILIHNSSGASDGERRVLSPQLLRQLAVWLKRARRNRVNEAIDEKDWETQEPHSFCGTGYVVVTTYENLRRNADVYTAHEWSYLVLDEAQKIRNPDADITLVCKRIRTPHRLAMSGTPIQNDLRELWSLFDFCFPGRLGTLPAFEQEFAVPIKRGGYSNASPMQVQLAYRCAMMLRDLIDPFLLRRLKKDVKEVSRMPGKTEHVLFCRLSKRQRDMYEAYLQSEDVTRVLRGNAQIFAAVTVLRKIANHPDLVCDPNEASFQAFLKNGTTLQHPASTAGDDSSEDYEDFTAEEETLMERSGKLEVLSKILPLWHKQGHRVLIFCQWRKMLNIIQRFMMIKGWKFGRLDGNTNIASRQGLVDSFNRDDSYFAMLCTTRTGGVGLNLTGANRIILYDPDWNPSGDAQARERAWRFGQEREVTIYRLITAGTIEEKIYQRQIFKTALTNKVLQDPKQRRLFSQRDLRDLFTLSADTGSVRSGGDGITETSKVTKGVGVVDRHDDLVADTEDKDNVETLKKVMKSKGLAGIFDHHSLEQDSRRKSTTVREMEEQAKRVAKEAADALKQSTSSSDPFSPTWTGSEETNPSRFGPSNRGTAHSNGSTLASSSVAAGPTSSSSLLASIRQRNTAIESGGKSDTPTDETKKYVELLGDLKQFVYQRRPTTEEILKEFDSVPDSDVAIFKRLLKSVAAIDSGRWYLLKE